MLYKNIIFPIKEYFPNEYMDEYKEKLEIFLIALEKPGYVSEMFINVLN